MTTTNIQEEVVEKLSKIAISNDIDDLDELLNSNSKEVHMYLNCNNNQILKLACEYESIEVLDKLWNMHQQLLAVSKSNGLPISLKILLEEQLEIAFNRNKLKTLDYILTVSGLYKNEAVYPKLIEMLKNITKNTVSITNYILDFFDKPNVFEEQILNRYESSHILAYYLRSNPNVIVMMLDREHLVKPLLLYLKKNAMLIIQAQAQKDASLVIEKVSGIKNISAKYLSELYNGIIGPALYYRNEELLRYFIIEKNCPKEYIDNKYKEQLNIRHYMDKELKEFKKQIDKMYDTKNLYLKLKEKTDKKVEEEEPIKRKKI